MFIVTTIVAAGCYWLMLPTVNAQRFVRAVAAAKYASADAYFCNADDQFLSNSNNKRWHFKATAELAPWSLQQLLKGKRLVRIRVTSGDATVRTSEWLVAATRAGLLQPEPTWPRYGSVGGAIDVPLIPTAPTS